VIAEARAIVFLAPFKEYVSIMQKHDTHILSGFPHTTLLLNSIEVQEKIASAPLDWWEYSHLVAVLHDVPVAFGGDDGFTVD